MAQYSISDIEMLTGIKAHTLRIWEQRYNFLTPHRTDTNIRYYTDDQLKLILNIGLLNRNGFKISKIAEMKSEDLKSAVLEVTSTHQEPSVYLDALTHAMIDFDEALFEKTLSSAIMRSGFYRAFHDVIFPFMQRTGILWSTGVVRPAQEHFISNLIRRKLSVAIDNQFVQTTEKSKRFVLFLPSGENHELLLLFTEYVLRMHQHEVAYIGTSVPFEDISFIRERFKPDYLVTFFTISPAEMPLQVYIERLASSFSDLTLLIGGSLLQTPTFDLPSNVRLVKSVNDLEGVLNFV